MFAHINDVMDLEGQYSKVIKVRGRVTRGLGEGGFYVAKYMGEFEKALGFKPFQGTLNIELVNPVEDLSECRGVFIRPPTPDYAPVLAYKALVNNEVEVFIVKPFKTRHGSRIIEIISKHKLRDVLGLKDGDIIEVSILCNSNHI